MGKPQVTATGADALCKYTLASAAGCIDVAFHIKGNIIGIMAGSSTAAHANGSCSVGCCVTIRTPGH